MVSAKELEDVQRLVLSFF